MDKHGAGRYFVPTRQNRFVCLFVCLPRIYLGESCLLRDLPVFTHLCGFGFIDTRVVTSLAEREGMPAGAQWA